MASLVVQGREDTAQDCITAMNVAINALTVTTTFGQGVIKVGSNEWRYYFIYN
tara:strand:+ start:1232 stop:1390 length:159 start_codon:yes stop_codon:yes gene_type:complete